MPRQDPCWAPTLPCLPDGVGWLASSTESGVLSIIYSYQMMSRAIHNLTVGTLLTVEQAGFHCIDAYVMIDKDQSA